MRTEAGALRLLCAMWYEVVIAEMRRQIVLYVK